MAKNKHKKLFTIKTNQNKINELKFLQEMYD